MSSSSAKSLLRRLASILPVGLLPLDGTLRLAQRAAHATAGFLFVRDWRLQTQGRPQFFKHQINLSRWTFEPSRWSFTARGVYAREHMFRGCRVLDLCCGEGSYSYLFFSDIAGSIDAVDNDPHALAYARAWHKTPVISYHSTDLVSQPLPGNDYDVVVWNAAICYFSESEIRSILGKIAGCGKPTMVLTGMLPKANGWIDHKTEFADRADVELLLRGYFATVVTREIDEGSAITFYFQASAPLRTLGDVA